MRRPRILIAALCLAAWASTATAATFGETVMVPGLLTDLPQDQSLVWQHSRSLPEVAPDTPDPGGGYRRLAAIQGQTLELSRNAEKMLVLQRAGRMLAAFPERGPNPILLMFLENVMRSVAQETGGSPHYIRNRMRHTLGAAQVDGNRLLILPFDTDPNRPRFGDFADLVIDIRWAEGNPGLLLHLSAILPEKPELYSEILIHDPAE